MSPIIPDPCGVAFKEWAGVCRALLDGRQTVILRKGGIAEGPNGFVPEFSAFWLYPTWTHQATQGLLDPVQGGPPSPGVVSIEALAVVRNLIRLERESDLGHLEGFHRLRPETLTQRFHYRTPGLWVLDVRVYRRPEPASVTVTPEQEGCKTWVQLEGPIPTAGLVPVLDESGALERSRRLGLALNSPPILG